MKRDYFYHVDARGTLTLDGIIQDDPWFLDLFYRRLAQTANPMFSDYPYVSRCGDEMNYLSPADTPIVYMRRDGDRLLYAAGTLSVPFEPASLTYSSQGVLYHKAPVGTLGRIVPSLAMELSRDIHGWGPWYAYRNTDGSMVVLEPMERQPHLVLLRPRKDNLCVGCGEANSASMKLSFLHDQEAETVHTWIVPGPTMQGALGVVHGGLVSLLLDEVMGKSLSVRGVRAPTASLTVQFRKPMLTGVEYHCLSRLIQVSGRKYLLSGAIQQMDGVTVAESEGLFIAPTSERVSL
jgi:acyl-coenzyme A thioesterase PaaI-like protein